MSRLRCCILMVLAALFCAFTAAWWRDAALSRYAAVGAALFEAGAYQEALDMYLKALRLKPSDLWILYNVGCARIRLGDFQQAVRDLETAALKSRDSSLKALAHHNLGTVWFREARAQQSAGKAPGDIEALYRLSVENYRAALRWDPSDLRAAAALAAAKRDWNTFRAARVDPTALPPSGKSPEKAKHGPETGSAGKTDLSDGMSQGSVAESAQSLSARSDHAALSGSPHPLEETSPMSIDQPLRGGEAPLAYHPFLSRRPAERLGEPLDLSSPEKALENILALEEAHRRSRMLPKPVRIDVMAQEW